MGIVILLLCAYEAVAMAGRSALNLNLALFVAACGVAYWLATGDTTPTLTAIAHRWRDAGPWVAMAGGTFSAWLLYHLTFEGR